MDKKELMTVIDAIIDKEKANGCIKCKHELKEEWEKPCCICKRGCKDYYTYNKE